MKNAINRPLCSFNNFISFLLIKNLGSLLTNSFIQFDRKSSQFTNDFPIIPKFAPATKKLASRDAIVDKQMYIHTQIIFARLNI